MSVDKEYCMSSYLAFRYVEDGQKDFFEGMQHRTITPIPAEDKISVHTAHEIDQAIKKQFERLPDKKRGILLSGGMDSAILASYMPGCDAYTFRFLDGKFQKEEEQRAQYYADYYGLKLHYVDIHWGIVEQNIDALMKEKSAPIHSIEPQIMQGALQAKADGMEQMITGASSDLLFGGMDQLLSQDWSFDGFVNRYLFIRPEDVLKYPESMQYVFERYRQGDKIDFLKFLQQISLDELFGSYENAFSAAGMPYYDPYARLEMAEPLDLYRVRHGEPKYLIRELFSIKYPEIPIPDKISMPRPVDFYFANWNGPTRPEFKQGLDMEKFTGNQKWQLWCLQRFLNLYDPI